MVDGPVINEHNQRLKVEKLRRRINQIHDRRVRSWADAEVSIRSLQHNLEALGEVPEDLFQPDWEDPSMLMTYRMAGLDH